MVTSINERLRDLPQSPQGECDSRSYIEDTEHLALITRVVQR